MLSFDHDNPIIKYKPNFINQILWYLLNEKTQSILKGKMINICLGLSFGDANS